MSVNIIDNKKGDIYTGHEIFGQPGVWEQTYKVLLARSKELKAFLDPLLSKADLRIVLSGAGSSAFIGEVAQHFMAKHTGRITLAIPTTDIVTHPQILTGKGPILLISFARSGNSPESLESVELANMHGDIVHHLIITCNKDGKLARRAAGMNNCLSLVLPEGTNDQGLAMTGSFTSMLLAVLLISEFHDLEEKNATITQIVEQVGQIFGYKELIRNRISKDFERVVFLGSGAMTGIARECSLKLLELTDGQVIGAYDSFLAFRHGPRAVVNNKTLMVYLFSADPHVVQYEADLALSIAEDPRRIPSLCVGDATVNIPNAEWVKLDLQDDEYHLVPYAVVGQLLAYYKSLHLDLNPDNPSVSGAISRVVKGVKIYKNGKP